MNALRPWRVWFVPFSLALTCMPLVLTMLGRSPGIEMATCLAALPFAIGLVIRSVLDNPLVALVSRHRIRQIRIALLVGLPLVLVLTVPVQVGRGSMFSAAVAVAGAEAIIACLIGIGLHAPGWRSQVRQAILVAALLGCEVLATGSPAALPGPVLLAGLCVLGLMVAWWWHRRIPGEDAPGGGAPAPAWWEQARSLPRLPARRWLEITAAFAVAWTVASWVPIALGGEDGRIDPTLMLIALGLPCWAAWNRCVPWLRRRMLAEVLAVSAAWPLPRRSWGWSIQVRLISQALPDAAAAAVGVITGTLLADPGGSGVLLAVLAVAGWIPVTVVAVQLAVALMAQDWLLWAGGILLMVVGGSALLNHIPADRPGPALAILAAITLPPLLALTVWQARRIARREW
jgi:hypothetical protein